MILWSALVPAGLFLLILMSVIWGLSVWLRNAGIVDVAWAAGFAPLCWIDAWLVPGLGVREALFVGMVTIWALRLGWHLGRRVHAHHPVEDGRYAALRARWGKEANGKMLSFFYLQGALMLVLSIPFLIVLSASPQDLSILEIAGCVIWIVALVGESLADAQLSRFKADPTHKGAVCNVGLWRYSRHPNYFFEWLVWVSFFVFALPAPWGWTTLYAPALMLFFLTCLTGIKMTEEQSLKTKGEAYRRYQQSTSAFVPWFPKSV